ncbi:MAG: imidazole glycerol phosphate synthase subunit HisH [Cyanobacteriota bacterium]|jgi:glutamine amidotransferase|nr:imidazole glycerol phosphate synthase subunit HisH [Cyanobacteriota bacterium]
MIGVIDYGMGNLHSVEKALARLGAQCRRIDQPDACRELRALVLPGVGAFDPAVERLRQGGWEAPLQQWQADGRPLLGICLGLQLLFEGSDEGQQPGLGLLAGRVEALPEEPREPRPHMGWAPLLPDRPTPLLDPAAPPPWMYFVHSYAAVPADGACITARASYGATTVVAAVGCGALQAVQFHPEKSGKAGLQLLQRWLASLP